MRCSLVTPSTDEVLSLPEAMGHLQLDEDQWADHAENVTALVTAAEQAFERHTERQLLEATWKLELDRFPRWGRPIVIPHPPLVSVSSVEYIDGAGAPQTWDPGEYVVNAPAGPHAHEGQLYPGFGKAYPGTACIPNAVAVTYVAGYASAALVPYRFKQAMLLMLNYWFRNRDSSSESSLPLAPPTAAIALMDQARTWQSAMA